ncbi:MAG TPA: enoyl-CoA hydratase/isomerase family protein [Steroidobacteraceae bacterium]|nr:enoyl-CoA hydratase/isomerase family protein [Steroidobacteraceae bacterium]
MIRREVLNRIAFITLDRPAALNALNLDMIVQLRTALCEFAVDPDVYAVLIRGAGEKAFCAGGDIRAIYESAKIAHGPQLDFFETEYPLDYLLYSYPKPYIALIDGIVMGGGMGISQGSRLRIVGDRTRMAMPEVAIGFFPDVGASYFLSRLAGALGPYLALTGVQLRAADALYTGLADLYLPLASLPRLESELAALTWNTDRSQDPRAAQDARAAVEGVIHGLASAAPPAPLAALRPAIDEHFAAANVPAVLKSLEGESRPEFAAWARQTIDLMHTRSPTMLAVTWEQLKRGRSMSLAACLRMELGLVRQAFFQGDFMEGVRAVIVDKDNAPVWRPTRIDEVTDEMVAAMFTDPWAGAEHPLAHLEGVHACS